jgi:signal peptidase I
MNPEEEHRKLSQEQVYELSTELLASKHSVKLRLGGFSMYPSLKPGDVATIEQCPLTALKPGDVIAFKVQNRWIAHRLIKKEEAEGIIILHTRGDSCLNMDKPIKADSYAGKIISIERNNNEFTLSSFYGKTIAVNQFYNLFFYILVKLKILYLKVKKALFFAFI